MLELLRLSRIVPETNVSSENVVLPTFKQLEELKLYLEDLRTTKIDQSNEITRLKKTLDRMNKSSLNLKQSEQEIEIQREKLQSELDGFRQSVQTLEEQLKFSRREKENLLKEIENRSSSLNVVQLRLQKILGKTNSNSSSSSSSLESDLNLLEKQLNVFESRCHSLEEKLIERDTGTLHLTQQLEEQVLRLKQDFEHKHHNSLKDKDQLLQRHLKDIQNLSLQLQVRFFSSELN